MIVTKGLLQRTASEIRAAESALSKIVGEFRDAGVWTGADAERFAADWNDQVRLRLLAAAATIDSVAVITLV